MNMSPESKNPHVETPVVKSMPGRLKKKRNREFGETKKCGKMSRKGVNMTCSICQGKNHNKRGCPLKDSIGSSGVVIGPSDVPSTSRPREMPRNTPTTTDAPPRPRGRLRETSDNPKAPPRPRGRPRKTSDSPKAPPRPRGRPRKTTQAEQVARPPTLEESLNEPVAPNTRGGERDVEHVAIAARSRGRGVEHIATQGKR
ncbi:cuticle collagen dpy-7-like [Capsicum annuum]|uniref:cuticle collagen dpy-7-like n=1 Tax=Capsicum annuum TaxID=4072 RepID=UPI001FB0D088|nr:cuticle collagen dpy-7-like [Capsicum annuum]